MPTKRKKIIRRKTGNKTKRQMYFTKETQEAISKFCSTEVPKEREDLYVEHIKPALEKLAENSIAKSAAN